MKDYVPRSEDGMVFQIIEFVSLRTLRVPNENAPLSSWVKFRSMTRKSGDVTKGPKNTKVKIVWSFFKHDLMRSFIFQNGRRSSVDEKTCRKYGIPPKFKWKTSLEQ